MSPCVAVLCNTYEACMQTRNKLLNHTNKNVMPQNVFVHLHFVLWCSLLVPFTSNKTAFYCGTTKSQVKILTCSYEFPSSDNICIPVECLLTYYFKSAHIPTFNFITNRLQTVTAVFKAIKTWVWTPYSLLSLARTQCFRTRNFQAATAPDSKRAVKVWKTLGNLQCLNLRLGYPHCAHFDFWIWYDERPHRRHRVCVLLRRFPKLDVPFV